MARVQTTQSTGKLWKLIQLVGVLGIIAGATWGFVAYGSDDADGFIKASLVMVGAAPVWIFGRVGAWWFHG